MGLLLLLIDRCINHKVLLTIVFRHFHMARILVVLFYDFRISFVLSFSFAHFLLGAKLDLLHNAYDESNLHINFILIDILWLHKTLKLFKTVNDLAWINDRYCIVFQLSLVYIWMMILSKKGDLFHETIPFRLFL